MFRTLCAFLLLASPALGLDIYEDFTMTEANATSNQEWIHVYGDATFTMDSDGSGDGAWWTSNIHLHDSSSFVLNQGRVVGSVRLMGDNSVTMNGGILRGAATVVAYEGSQSTIELLGGELRAGSFDLSKGTHDVVIRDVQGGASFGGDVFVTAYDESPRYTVDIYGANLFMNGVKYDVPHSSWLIYSTAPVVDGDTNRDGQVDLADLNNVRNGFGVERPLDMLGDTFPLDGITDLTDLNRVRNNFGAAEAVPEPSTLLITLALLTPAALLQLRRRKREAFPHTSSEKS